MSDFTMSSLALKLDSEGLEYILDLHVDDVPKEIRGSFGLFQKHGRIIMDILQNELDNLYEEDTSEITEPSPLGEIDA